MTTGGRRRERERERVRERDSLDKQTVKEVIQRRVEVESREIDVKEILSS